MHILAIETSNAEGSVALHGDSIAVAERRLETAGRRHAQTLLAEIDGLLRSHGVPPADIGAVAVSLGPGSFTGLRVGVVCAKTWAFATGCPVLGIETYAAFALQAPDQWHQTWVIGDAQRGDFFAAEYRRTPDVDWKRERPLAIVPGESWLAERSSEEHIIGPGVLRVGTDSTSAQVCRDEWAIRPSATAIGRVAASRIATSTADDPWTLEPIYLRPSAAEEKRSSGGV